MCETRIPLGLDLMGNTPEYFCVLVDLLCHRSLVTVCCRATAHESTVGIAA
jgi:hypothetical protein